MTATEATKQDWEDLKNRVESRTAREKRKEWDGENDPELWVKIVAKEQREKKLQQEIDQAIRAGNGRAFAAKEKGEEEIQDEYDYFRAAMAFFFLAGMIVGAAVLFLVQYFI